jgi:hypothetical protein
MPEKIPGFGAGPKETDDTVRQNGNRKFTIFAIQLLPKIKTVADPCFSPEDEFAISPMYLRL